MSRRRNVSQFALFGKASAPRVRRTNQRIEQSLVKAAVKMCNYHPKVAYAWRANSGAFVLGDGDKKRFVRCNFTGCSDVLGLMKDGRFMALEGKRDDRDEPTEEQAWFQGLVRDANGVHGVFRSLDDVEQILEAA